MSFKNISYEIKNDICYVGFGLDPKKSMTTLTEETLQELRVAVSRVHENPALKGLIFHSHVPGCFLAGGDVTIIQGLKSEADAHAGCEAGQSIFNMIEDLKIPTMALVDGICLGGGLELSLSCDKIMVSDNPKTALGLPEVMLGVLPGFGGTYRLPKRLGLPGALDLILTGKQVKGFKAVKLGLADGKLPTERMLELAPKYLSKKKEGNKTFKESMEELATDNFISRKIIFQKARESVLDLTKGFYPAPLKILEHLEANHGKSRELFLQKEAEAFAELSQSYQSKNLQHIFFLTDATKKMEYSGKLKKVKRGAVLGAGTMGGGIAWLFASNDQAPLMKDITQAALELGLKQSSSVFRKDVIKKKMSEDEFDRKQRSIQPVLTYDGFKGVDMVIEAVVENMDIKKKVFADLEQFVQDDALITSNTSSLSVTEMAKAFKKPERFAGLHFFNPVNKMPLVEIIKHPGASEETLQSLYKWVLAVKKTPIIVGDGPGFLVNRILMPFINESVYLLEEGVSIEALDKAVLNFGMPMGTCRLMDEIGIDVLVKVGKIMHDGLGARAYPASLSAGATEKGLLGRKTNKGFYNYDEAGKPAGINSDMEAILPKQKKEMDETTIQMRVILPMINEAANILQDKIVDKAADVDVGLIYGIGFPPFKGGLLKYADTEGLARIGEVIQKFASEVNSDRYALSPYLAKLIKENKTFY